VQSDNWNVVSMAAKPAGSPHSGAAFMMNGESSQTRIARIELVPQVFASLDLTESDIQPRHRKTKQTFYDLSAGRQPALFTAKGRDKEKPGATCGVSAHFWSAPAICGLLGVGR
jgi:hypothetical protein